MGKAGAAVKAERQRLFQRRGDLRIRDFPHLPGAGSIDPPSAVDAIGRWADRQAQDAIEWYLRDKRIKRVGSRLLRASTVLLVTAGGVLPLVGVARTGQAGGWGYALLAIAAGCAAFDHFFGVSSGWMRDVATAQALQRRLAEYRLEWSARLLVRPPAGPDRVDGTLGSADGEELSRRLELIKQLTEDIIGLVEAETAEWLAEFRTSIGKLYGQISPPRPGE